MDIAVKLKVVRVDRDLTQRELAEKAGISAKAISELESGKSKGITFKVLASLCAALDCEVQDILRLVPAESTESNYG